MYDENNKEFMDPESTNILIARNDKSKVYLWIFILFSLLILIIGMTIGFFMRGACETSYDIDWERTSRSLQNDVKSIFLREQLELYSSKIHQAGSDQNFVLAELMSSNWKMWGVPSTQLFQYKVNITVANSSNPSTVRLIFNGSTLKEFPTAELNNTLPRYHSYSIGGRSRGRFVFINYGLSKDLNYLKTQNVTVCGNTVIPIVRLGFSDRAAKVKHLVSFCGSNLPGGLLVYPDPWDYAVDSNDKSSNPNNTRVYPDTWWLPSDAGVFGNMKMRSGLQSADLPSMDGIFNTVDISELMTPFPVQPISYGDAREIFSFMRDKKRVPESWGNCLPKYLESTDNYELDIDIKNSIVERNITNVIGYIPGSVEKDRYVIVGNHRDAWAMGTSDPGSGTAILQQVTRILASAYKKGIFKPMRSIIFANWDGEEQGLLGSTEFTSQFSSDLSQRCVAYVNMDCPIKGSWSFAGRSTPLMIGAMLDSARNVLISPDYTLFDDWKKKNPQGPDNIEPKVEYLGGGSDHILFAYVLGIPSAYPEYKFNQSLASMPAYHTKYDNIDMMTRLVDPQLDHHSLLSKFVIDYTIRLSSSPIIPYSVDRLTHLLLDNFPKLKKSIESVVNQSDYTVILYKQLLQFNDSATRFNGRLVSRKLDALKLRFVNDLLLQLPRQFISREGLPTRPHLRNILLSTRLTNSYLGSVFTGVHDAIDLYHSHKVDLTVLLRQMSILSDSVRRATDLLNGGFVSIF